MDTASRFLEGDYIETVDGLFFAVKGLHHPVDGVIATLRYVPDPEGERERDGVRYRRMYDLEETTRLLAAEHPGYLNRVEGLSLVLQTVPLEKIRRIYKPVERLAHIMKDPRGEPETTVSKFVEALREASGAPEARFGISGSLLIGLQRPESDVDLNVYGASEGRRVYETLKHLREVLGWVEPYDDSTVQPVLEARWGRSGLSLETLRGVEKAKVLHGLVSGRDYFIRLIRDREEDASSRPLGAVTVRATVADAEGSIYTPCIYRVVGAETQGHAVTELLSFRGKFTEMAVEGDVVEARGTLEEVGGGEKRYRVVLGGRGDYLVPVRLLDA
ncbi:MAG TPA: nucleotidyltransferase domain-containing protein [Candidatus Krumholzibacteriaceae bacterium]|nr:nucleotidyltransferase domain-containing protein [Candidatus Krumholzibacteriaceae bacterium]